MSFGVGCIRVMARRVPSDEAGPGHAVRAGFAVPKKTGHAVRRNRIRRIMRETWREKYSFRGEEDTLAADNVAQTDVLTVMFLFRNPGATEEDLRRDMRVAAGWLRTAAASARSQSHPHFDSQARG